MNTRKPIQDLSGTTMADRYILERCIGRGGFATVYRAVDNRLGSVVAVKVLHPENTRNVKDVDRFFNEAKIAGRISDERLVKVYDYFQDGDRCGFVMEHLEGCTLRDLLIRQEGEVLWWPRAFKLALEVCQALEVAHANEVVHRDIKPENIFLIKARGGVDRLKILDLGVAKVLQSWSGVRQGISNARDIIGSPFYMAPEQVEGTTGCDGRADIYSLGVVLYEMVTGAVPFRGSNDFETMYHHVKSAPTPPLTLRPTLKLPRPLEGIIMTALEKSPEKRFRNVQEMSKAIAFELERTSSKQRVWHVAQMLPAVSDSVAPLATTAVATSGDTAPERPRRLPSEPTIGRTTEPAVAVPQQWTSGRVVEEMTTRKRVDARPAAGVVRVLPRAPLSEVRTSNRENDLTPAPKQADSQPSGNTKITSPDVEVASSESRPIAPRAPAQLGLHPRSIMMLASMVAASLLATCSAGSVLAMVLDARHDPESGRDGRGRVDFIAADDSYEPLPKPEPPHAPESTPKTAGASPSSTAVVPAQPVVPPLETAAVPPSTTPAVVPTVPPPGATPSGASAQEPVSPAPVSQPKAAQRTTVKRGGKAKSPTAEEPPELMPITSTMRSLAERAASSIRKQCKISRHAGERSHEYRVRFTVRATGEVVSVAEVGEAPIMAKDHCVLDEAKRIVKTFAGATDLRESFEHTFPVVRE